MAEVDHGACWSIYRKTITNNYTKLNFRFIHDRNLILSTNNILDLPVPHKYKGKYLDCHVGTKMGTTQTKQYIICANKCMT